MMYFAWKVLVPLMIGLIVAQAIIQKLPTPVAVQYVLIFIANVGVMAVVAYVLQKYFREEQMRTKRSFEPTSLIGSMQVSEKGTMY